MIMHHERCVELVGHGIVVTHSSNPSLEGLKGRVVDETRNTMTLETQHGMKRIIKKQVTVKKYDMDIEGTSLVGRIEERLKKLW